MQIKNKVHIFSSEYSGFGGVFLLLEAFTPQLGFP